MARLLAVLLVLLVTRPGHASSDLAEEADLHFEIAVSHYRDGDYLRALEHLLRSNRLVPNRNVVFNIARAYERLERYDDAYRHYVDYVAMETDPAMRSAGEDALERIAEEVALVRIESRPPGATIYIGRRELGARGSTPRTLALPPGNHPIFLELPGHAPAEAVAEVAIGETAEVSARLAEELGQARVYGSPEGAEVRLGSHDGVLLGTVPSVVTLPAGSHTLTVDADRHHPLRQVVQIPPRGTTDVTVDLSLRTGTVVVDALERDALIEIGGRVMGFTPAVLEVPVGSHDLRVSLRGFRPHEETIEVHDDARTAVDLRLRTLQEVTAASRATESVEEAPASVSVVSRREIRAFGYQTLYDALGGTRGIYQTNDLSYQYLGFRGFSRLGDYGNRVLLTMDGHTINDDMLGASYVGEDLLTDLGDVEQIEVVRGPGSALYGSNAFFGVINLVTRGPDDPREPHATVTATELGTGRARAGAGFGDADRGGWLSAAGFVSQGDDYYFPAYDVPREGDGHARGADGARGGTLLGRAWLGDLTFQGYFHGRAKRIPTGAFDTILADPRTISRDHRSFGELRYEPTLGDNVSLYTRAYVDFYRFAGDYPYPEAVAVDRWNGSWAGVEPRVVADLTPWLEVTAGAEGRIHYLADLYSFEQIGDDEEPYLDEQPTQQVWSAYALAEARARWVRASLGGRYDHFTLEGIGGAFSPRAAVLFTPTEQDVVKLLAGTAFRAPSPYELFYEDDGVTQLRPTRLVPERIFTGEIEASRRFDEVTSVSVALYYNRIENLVDTELTGEHGPEGELFRYANADDTVRSAGFEVELRREWRQGILFAAQHSIQRSVEGDLLTGTPLTNSPAHLVGLKAAAPIVSGVSTVATRLRAESPRRTTQGTRTAWGLLWDVTVTGDLSVVPLSWGFGVRNLLDWQVEHPGGFDLRQPAVPQPGRTFFATVEARL